MWGFLAGLFTLCNADQKINEWYPMGGPEPAKLLQGEWKWSDRGADLMMRETPMQVYLPMRINHVHWGCIALHSSDYLDGITVERPYYIPPMSTFTSYHRTACIIYAFHRVKKKAFGSGSQMEFEGQMEEKGFMEYALSDEDYMEIKACVMGPKDSHQDCVENTKAYQALDPNDKKHDLRLTAITGAYLGAHVLKDMKTDCWNYDGSQRRGCDKMKNPRFFANCAEYADTTGYKPVNSVTELKDNTRWQPLMENDMHGFVYAQEHVTPQIGACKGRTRGFGVTDEMLAREAPDPAYDLDAEMELAFDNVADLATNKTKAALVYLMDNKLRLLGGILSTMQKIEPWSLEAQSLFMLGYTVVEREAVVVAWKEKVRHDLIRPTSYAQHVVEEKEVTWYDGTKISSKVWQPFIRVMPHAEYPSGSMAICKTIADYTKRWLNDGETWAKFKDVTDLQTTWTAKKGSAGSLGAYDSDGEPLPKEEISVTMKDMDQLAHVCGVSRLWGGMHFRASVQAASDLVEGYGDATFEYVKTLLNGKKIPSAMESSDSDRIKPMTRNKSDVTVDIKVKQCELESYNKRTKELKKKVEKEKKKLKEATDQGAVKRYTKKISQKEYAIKNAEKMAGKAEMAIDMLRQEKKKL